MDDEPEAQLDRAVAEFKSRAAACPDDDPNLSVHLSNLAVTLGRRFRSIGRRADLDRAVDTAVRAANECARWSGHPGWGDTLFTLGDLARERFELAGEPSDAERAVQAFRRGQTDLAAGSDARLSCLNGLGNVLNARYRRTGPIADLDESVAASRQAVEETPDDTRRNRYHYNLAVHLAARFHATDRLDDLDDAIHHFGRASADPANRLSALSGHATALGIRSERTSCLADSAGAVDRAATVIDEAEAGDPQRPMYLAGLGTAWHGRFGLTGRRADIDMAVRYDREAVRLVADTHPDRAGYISNLANALQLRYDLDGEPGDLDDSVEATQSAVAATPPGDPNRAGRLSTFGSTMHVRFHRYRRMADLDAGIAASREAVELAADEDPSRASYLNNLTIQVRTRADVTSDPAGLDEAVALARETVAATPQGHPKRPGCEGNLSSALRTRFRHRRSSPDLDEAVSVCGGCLAGLAPDRPVRASIGGQLGDLLAQRWRLSGRSDDLDAAVEAYQAAASTPTGLSTDKLSAATSWGNLAFETGRTEAAAQGYRQAISLTPELAWHGLTRGTRERRLALLDQVAVRAAVCEVRCGRPAGAVEQLDACRSVMLMQTLDLQIDLSQLAAHAPDLAARFVAAGASLSRAQRMAGEAEHAGR
ncbi:MAG: hypothetical protein ACR2GH_14790 [Pseudonocardia sp.]